MIRDSSSLSGAKLTSLVSNLYTQWRANSGLILALREDPAAPPERLLQLIWFHQRLVREKFTTLDGQSLRILHPGFWNHEGGPDFRNALIQFANEPARIGDIEIDLRSSCWQGHRHDRNPAFAGVLLHVVWEGDAKTALPTLALKPFLDASLEELALWLGSDMAPAFPAALRGQCWKALVQLTPAQRNALLHQAALVRLQSKAAYLHARARQAGWEQALWEGLFRALGYKHNVWPMQRLAELRASVAPPKSKPLALQARLLGIGGLLPDDLPHAGSDQYVRTLWDFWWRERESFAEDILPPALWRFHGLRPANHPQRRLALAAHWLARNETPARLETWCTQPVKEASLVPSLLEILQVGQDDFWSWHWTLRSKRLTKPQPLLGATRVTDLAVNVILPWLWIRAIEGRNDSLRHTMEQRYLHWPAAEDNSVLRLARQRLFAGLGRREFANAAAQQGLLQIGRDFCEQTNPICQNCRFPEFVQSCLSREHNLLGSGNSAQIQQNTP
jgi:hypothetical protein